MNIAHIDLVSGASGDKLVSALLDIAEQIGCYSLEQLDRDLSAVEPNLHVERERIARGGISAWHVTMLDKTTGKAADAPEALEGAHVHEHSHAHDHDHGDGHVHTHEHTHEHAHDHEHHHDHDHDHAHEHHHDHGHGHHHAHRHWSDIRAMLEAAPLSERARELSLKIFERIAVAEASVHGKTVEDVAFHEVGALDSIGDIVSCALIVAALEAGGPVRFVATPLALGAGHVHAAHGILPVPAPATALIVRGLPCEAGAANCELTTPTGAAVIAEIADAFGPLPPMRVEAVGSGAGTREIDGLPNVLRIMWGTSLQAVPDDEPAHAEDAGLEVEGVVLLDCNIDHISGEAAADACKRLLEEGALDVWQEPIAMKKGRLAIRLNVLARPLDADRLATLAHRLTGTLGLRRSYVQRTVAKRAHDAVETGSGLVRFKSMIAEGEDGEPERIWVRPEADDVARIARETGEPFQDVAARLAAEGEAALSDY